MATMEGQTQLAMDDCKVKGIEGVKKAPGNKIMYLLEWDRQWIREDFLKGCEMLIEIFNDSQNEELYGYSVKKNAASKNVLPPNVNVPSRKKTSGSYALVFNCS
jgi:hypothetical protein